MNIMPEKQIAIQPSLYDVHAINPPYTIFIDSKGEKSDVEVMKIQIIGDNGYLAVEVDVDGIHIKSQKLTYSP